MNRSMLALCACGAALGCASEEGTNARGGDDLVDIIADSAGKSDEVSRVKVVDGIGLDSTVSGTFSRATRVYGYVFDVYSGATVTASLGTVAGDDAAGVEAGAVLDTRMSIYGPYESPTNAGERIAESDDGANDVGPADLRFEVEQDGRYLVVFSSWDDTGESSKYTLELGCEGTDFQCRRPDWERPCDEGKEYIQGRTIDSDTTWTKCEVVLLEPVTVNEGVTLTVRPGVHVLGNFFGGTAPFGSVVLRVEGTLQAAGTAEHPVAFAPYVEDHGWGGLQLVGPEHVIRHAFIDRTNIGVQLEANTTATLEDVVIEGLVVGEEETRASAAGVRAQTDVTATFTRALVQNFQTGLDLENARKLDVLDSVIRQNGNGVIVTAGTAKNSCNRRRNPPAPVWRDPTFVHSDIYDNERVGLTIVGDDAVVQVERSNIVFNGQQGIFINGERVSPESYIRNSNIYGNRGATAERQQQQVRSLHTRGELDVTWNHWRFISDPQLSAGWRFECGGGLTPEGFAPEPIAEAGPRLDNVVPKVREVCWQIAGQDR